MLRFLTGQATSSKLFLLVLALVLVGNCALWSEQGGAVQAAMSSTKAEDDEAGWTVVPLPYDRRLGATRELAPLRPFSFAARHAGSLAFLAQWFVDAGSVIDRYGDSIIEKVNLDTKLASTPYSMTVEGTLMMPILSSISASASASKRDRTQYQRRKVIYKLFPCVKFQDGDFAISNVEGFHALVHELAFYTSYGRDAKLGSYLPSVLHLGFYKQMAIFALSFGQANPRASWAARFDSLSLDDHLHVLKSVFLFYREMQCHHLIHRSNSILQSVILGNDGKGRVIVKGIVDFEQTHLNSRTNGLPDAFYVSPEGMLATQVQQMRKADAVLWLPRISFGNKIDLFNLGSVATFILASQRSAETVIQRSSGGPSQKGFELVRLSGFTAARRTMAELAQSALESVGQCANWRKVQAWKQALLQYITQQKRNIISEYRWRTASGRSMMRLIKYARLSLQSGIEGEMKPEYMEAFTLAWNK